MRQKKKTTALTRRKEKKRESNHLLFFFPPFFFCPREETMIKFGSSWSRNTTARLQLCQSLWICPNSNVSFLFSLFLSSLTFSLTLFLFCPKFHRVRSRGTEMRDSWERLKIFFRSAVFLLFFSFLSSFCLSLPGFVSEMLNFCVNGHEGKPSPCAYNCLMLTSLSSLFLLSFFSFTHSLSSSLSPSLFSRLSFLSPFLLLLFVCLPLQSRYQMSARIQVCHPKRSDLRRLFSFPFLLFPLVLWKVLEPQPSWFHQW